MEKRKKIFKIIVEHSSDIIFGILAGVGLVFIASALITLMAIYFPILQSYFTILYVVLYLFILISTSILFAKGWFKIIYLVSSLILSSVYVYTEIFGVIS